MCNSYFSQQWCSGCKDIQNNCDWNFVGFCRQMMNLNLQNTYIVRELCIDYSGEHWRCIAGHITYSLVLSVCMLKEILDIIQDSMHVVWIYEYYLTHANMAKYLYVSKLWFRTVLVKSGRCLGLTTLPPSCADCLEIWEPQPPGTLWACPGL